MFSAEGLHFSALVCYSTEDSRLVNTTMIIFHVRFAQVKKCSNEGRALMQLDFQQFRTQLERMSNIRLAYLSVLSNI